MGGWGSGGSSSSGGSSGGWGSGGGSSKPSYVQSSGGKGGGGLLSGLGHGLQRAGNIVGGVVTGTIGLGEDVGKFVGHGLTSAGAKDALAGLGAGKPSTKTQQAAANAGLSVNDYENRDIPHVAALAAGAKQTANEFVHPSTIAKNYSRDPLGSALNDAANLSIVLGPLAGAAGVAADAAEAGGEAGRLGSLASGIGKAARVTQTVASAPVKPYEFALGKIAAAPAVAEALDNMKERAATRSFRDENLVQPQTAGRGQVVQAFKPMSRLAADEQAGLTINARNEFGQAVPVLQGLSPVERTTVFERLSDANPNPAATPEAYQLAYDHKTGALPEDQAARMSSAAGPVTDLRSQRQADAVAGKGFAPTGGGLDPAQLGFEPIGKEGLAANDIRNAPARLQPMLHSANALTTILQDLGHRDLAAGINPSLAAIKASGEDAEHVIGGTTEGKPKPRMSGLVAERKTGAQYQRLGNSTEYDAPGQAKLEYRRKAQTVNNEFVQKLADPANGRVIQGETLDPEHAAGDGKELFHEARSHGLVPWEPTKGKTMFGGDEGNVAPDNVTHQTLFMTEASYKTLSHLEQRGEPSLPTKAFDTANRGLRKDALVMWPGYHAMFAKGNAFLLGTHGMLPLSPVELVRRGAEAVRMIRAGEIPPELGSRSLFADDQALLGEKKLGAETRSTARKAATAPLVPLKVWRAAGYRAAAWVDEASRLVGYLDQTAKGHSPAEAAATVNRVIGDFSNLGPYERDIVSRAFPVYPWVKHIVTETAKQAGNHPILAATMLHLGDIGQQQLPQGVPSWARGMLPLGGDKYADMSDLNPLSLITAPPGGFVNPIIKGSLAATTGLNTNTWQQYTRPGGGHGALWTNPKELGYILGGLTPITRFARDEASPPVQRYQTGEPKPSGAASERANPLARFAGIPLPEKITPSTGTPSSSGGTKKKGGWGS